MAEHISAAFGELINIIATANWHREHCQDSECNVALYQLGMTAKRLVDHCWLSERNRARRLIQETTWT